MARPALFGKPATDAIRVRVTREQRRDLEQVARENSTNVAGLIREAVNTFVEDYKDASVFRGPKLDITP
jgi:predicted DNA-binding protein